MAPVLVGLISSCTRAATDLSVIRLTVSSEASLEIDQLEISAFDDVRLLLQQRRPEEAGDSLGTVETVSLEIRGAPDGARVAVEVAGLWSGSVVATGGAEAVLARGEIVAVEVHLGANSWDGGVDGRDESDGSADGGAQRNCANQPWETLTPAVDEAAPGGALALDAWIDGSLRLLYENGDRLMYRKGTLLGEAWIWSTNAVPASFGVVQRGPSLGVDTSGVPHLLFFDQSDGSARYAKLAAFWVGTTLNSVSAGGPSSSDVDAAFTVHVTYLGDGGALTYCIFGSGKGVIPGNCTPTSLAWETVASSLKVDSLGTVHLAFVDGAALRYSTRGEEWAPNQDVESSDAWIALTVDTDDNPHVVFLQSSSELRHAQLGSKGWESVKIADASAGQVAVVADDTGTLHVSYFAGGSVRYGCLDAGGDWQTSTVAEATNANGSLIVDSSQEPHIFYYDAAGLQHAVRK